MVVAHGPPPKVSTAAKLVKQSMNIAPATPGRTRATAGPSISRKIAPGPMPSWLANRQFSGGTLSIARRKTRVANGMLKKTCASRIPGRP